MSTGGYVRKYNTFTLLLHNTLWRDGCGQIVRELEKAKLFGLALDALPFLHGFVLTLCA